MKLKYKLLSTLVMVGMVSPILSLTVMAETEGTKLPPPLPVRTLEARKALEAKKIEIKNERENFKADVKQKREEIRDERASTTRDIKERREEARAEIKDIRETQREENKSARNEIRGVELTNRVNNAVKMLTATANRLDTIITRIESRLEKIKTAGGNTTNVAVELATTKTDMASARTHISTISSIDLSGASTTVRTNFELVKTESKIVKDLFDQVRNDLGKVNNDLRELGKTKKVSDEAPKETVQ